MPHVKFQGRVLVMGCGAVSQCALPLLIDLIEVDPSKITILDFTDNRHLIEDVLNRGANYVVSKITEDNFKLELAKHVGMGDLIIDLTWNIDTIEMLKWCRSNSVLYINTSVEVWDPYADDVREDPRPYTLYHRQMKIREMLHANRDNSGTTSIVDHGANPGLVSHFTKYALHEIGEKILREFPEYENYLELEKALANSNFPKIAQLSNVRTIHISERDTQITDRPKTLNEFVNTWSVEGLYEEGLAPAELGWGSHEKQLPPGAFQHETGPQNQICLKTLGFNTWARSLVPCGEIVGMVIRHGEAFGISDRLTVWEGDKAVYRPTVHYVYCPSDSAVISLHELKMRQYRLQKEQRILTNEITDGKDELGVLLMGHPFKSWWCGSLLDIHETRKLAPGQNATTLQVAISVIAAAIWAIKNPRRGFNLPDDLDHNDILKVCKPYLGPFISSSYDWTPLDNIDLKYSRYGEKIPSQDDCWQFEAFLTQV